MLQQTTVATVDGYFRRFVALWPDVHALAAAKDHDVMAAWAGLGYYARARNLLKCARIVASRGGIPASEAELRKLPGIGPYTGAAITAIAFGQRAIVVDGNVERVMARYFAVREPLPASKSILRAHAASLIKENRPGDYAQAVMDLGAIVCTPKNPSCGICPVKADCAGRISGIASILPTRLAKAVKPIRHGQVWIAIREDGAFLTERRPESGLLGGMLALPTSGWDGAGRSAPPYNGDWQSIGEVRHTFTHFHLVLEVMRCNFLLGPNARNNNFVHKTVDNFTQFPTLFKKALILAFAADNA